MTAQLLLSSQRLVMGDARALLTGLLANAGTGSIDTLISWYSTLTDSSFLRYGFLVVFNFHTEK